MRRRLAFHAGGVSHGDNKQRFIFTGEGHPMSNKAVINTEKALSLIHI
jgi:hypothetical protein